MLHEILKRETADAHRALEKNIMDIMGGIRTTSDYVRFLKLMYGYYAAIEERAAAWLPAMRIEKRRTARRLLNDIRQYETHPDLSLCSDLPIIDSFASALGAMYVVEGSALGGPYIARRIAAQLGMTTNVSMTFFNGHPEETAQNWSEFKTNLSHSFDDNDQHTIIHGANTTFVTFSNWINQYAFV